MSTDKDSKILPKGSSKDYSEELQEKMAKLAEEWKYSNGEFMDCDGMKFRDFIYFTRELEKLHVFWQKVKCSHDLDGCSTCSERSICEDLKNDERCTKRVNPEHRCHESYCKHEEGEHYGCEIFGIRIWSEDNYIIHFEKEDHTNSTMVPSDFK